MASAFTHAFVGTIIGKAIKEDEKMPWRFWVGLALCSALPDVDVVAFPLGIPYDSPWGHRGFTHSIFFAAITAAATVTFLFWSIKHFSKPWRALWLCFFLATASHGFLDAFTNGGMGIAFFWPFSDARYFFPWRPILVSPVTVGGFFHERAFPILKSELLWVWFPTIILYILFKLFRKYRGEN